jgi:vesicle coat complex subunit
MIKNLLAFVLLTILLAACGGPVKRVFPPQVSLQEVVLNANGEVSAKFRIQNYSTVTTRFSRIVSNLSISGNEAARLDFNPDVSIGPGSIEVVSQTFALSPGAKASIETALKNRSRISYSLSGEINSSEPRSNFDIKYESALNPVPGLPNTLR